MDPSRYQVRSRRALEQIRIAVGPIQRDAQQILTESQRYPNTGPIQELRESLTVMIEVTARMVPASAQLVHHPPTRTLQGWRNRRLLRKTVHRAQSMATYLAHSPLLPGGINYRRPDNR